MSVCLAVFAVTLIDCRDRQLKAFPLVVGVVVVVVVVAVACKKQLAWIVTISIHISKLYSTSRMNS